MEKRMRLTSNRILQKCGKKEHNLQDQISQLPNDILVSILSLLTLNVAVATSVLSRRWLHLWMFTARLDFDANKILDRIAKNPRSLERERVKYVKWVNKVLQLHKGSTLEEFSVCFDLCKDYQHDIDNWLKFALARGVQKLELDLLRFSGNTRSFEKTYTFPSELFAQSSGPSLSQPHSDHGSMHPSAFVWFNSLKALCWRSVNVICEVLEFILSNCPNLERLVVHGSGQLVNFEVSGPSLMLRYLEVCWCDGLKSIKICNTNIVSLKVLGAVKIELDNLPLLVEVSIGGCKYWSDVIRNLSGCMSQLEVLTLHPYGFFETTRRLHDFPELSRLKQLVLIAYAKGDKSLLRYASLIKAAPYLEKFVLQLHWWNPSRRREEVKPAPICTHHYLKVVEFAGYFGRTSDLEFSMYFLQNAVALDELFIDPRKQFRSRMPRGTREYKLEEAARHYAKQQLEGIVPSRVKLVIL